MEQKQIEEMVRSIMAQMAGNTQTAVQAAQTPAQPQPVSVDDSQVESCAIDLGSDAAKHWIGVVNPHREDVIKELANSTAARVCCGRAGPRPRTFSLLRFLADHSRSKDTVLKLVPAEWVEKHNLFEVKSQVDDKDTYLTRPDLGRKLCEESVQTLLQKCKKEVDVQVVISDGLSTDSVMVNYDEIIPPLMKGLEQAGLKVGTPFFVRYGRVKIEDQIGELLKAKVVVLLIGERPGLGQSESLSCYAVYEPTVSKTVEADRTCISNIHKGGTPPVEAAGVIVDLAKRMLEKKASGIALTR